MKFTAIDFETANANRGSICAVGLAIVENDQIAMRLHQLIRPDPCRFDAVNIFIHGISDADVVDAPTFPQFWPNLWPQVSGPLVAHHAQFDMSALRIGLDRSGIQYPDTDYFCSRVIAKLAWPNLPTYELEYVANFLGIAFDHHDPEEDARACGLITIAACRQLNVPSLYDLKDACGLRVGRLFSNGYRTCGGPGQGHKLKAADITPSTLYIDEQHPYFGMSFVFTATMESMDRKDAMQLVVDHGGVCHDNVTNDTNYLVIGQAGFTGYQAGHKSKKWRDVELKRSKGLQIEILSEKDFLSFL